MVRCVAALCGEVVLVPASAVVASWISSVDSFMGLLQVVSVVGVGISILDA